MGRGLVQEKYFSVVNANAAPADDTEVRLGLRGAGAPNGTDTDLATAGIGSLYHDTTNGYIYSKIADAHAPGDWQQLGNVTLDQLRWRNERVVAATVDTLSAGAGQDPTSWSDNDSGVDATNWDVGDYVLGDTDGTPALWEITAKASATSITLAAASQAIVDGDTFIVQSYLPDPGASQEGQAIIHIPVAGSPVVKIGDVNWNFADGIRMAAGYTAQNGTISSADSVNSAIEKLDGNQQDIQTTLGVAQGSTNLGAFSSPASLFAAATYTVKSAFQRIFDLWANIGGYQAAAVTAETTVDEVLVDNVRAVKWLITAVVDADQSNNESFEVSAIHNGTTGADAANVDANNPTNKLKNGSGVAGIGVTVDLNGTGATQTMRLRCSASGATTFTVRRLSVLKETL